MRRLAAAALAALATLAATAAHAQEGVNRDTRDRGIKEAPAAVQKAGLTCSVTDAYFIGQNDNDKANLYEVACQDGRGYVISTGSKETKAYDCLATANQKTLACKLPANKDPKAALRPVVAAAGITCTPTNARYVGANATTSVYEVACQEGPGYILQAAAPGAPAKPTQAIPCIQATGTVACTLTTAAQNNAYLAQLVSKSGRQCQVSGSRYMGSDATGNSFYEVGCGQQAGFVLQADKAGGVGRTLSCSQAANLAGGCQLTSAAQIAAEATTGYTRQAQAAGYNCQVTKSRPVGVDPRTNAEIVELACAGRPDSVVAEFPPSGGAGRAQFFDCVQAGRFGSAAACTFSSPAAVYAKYTAALAAKGRSTCQVSNARYLGHNPDGTDLVETACSDGKPGWVIQVTPTYQATAILSCGQAKASGVACELPTNIRG